ncbi:hypothetical protein IPJ70_02585 [Candidatus Campbellbacteria bacterium]|nr:MAG: hypothetical protein IPJ70_02585 [Candidatus Campbellbacteria bacterium]
MLHNGTGRLKWRHFKILAQPLLVTLIVLSVWLWLHNHGYYQSKNDSDETTNSLIPLLGTFYAIVAGFILIRVIEEDGRIHECVADNDVERLNRELKKKIPPFVRVLLGAFTGLIIGATIFLPFDSVWSGIEHVGGTTFALSLYWMTALTLDNPFAVPGLRNVIPDEMRKMLEEIRDK